MKYPQKKTKIVCTIGPSSWVPEVMQKMIENGMNVARVNGAFADRAEMLKVEELVRQFSDEVGLMIDVKGPEVRLNKFAEALKLQPGQQIEIGSSEEFAIYPANYPDLYTKLAPEQIIVVGDGDVKLVVREVREKSFVVEVIFGTKLNPGKALNFPGFSLNENPLTEKDADLLAYAVEREWEFVSASFIRTANDAKFIKEKLGASKISLIAKIEDISGVENIDSIAEFVDGIMVARGGLGVDMGIENVPVAQRKLMKRARRHALPIIAATQMLESMTDKPIPTRAEANDVATAILEGTDAVMLSGESTTGLYPAEAVEFMSKVDAKIQELMKAEEIETEGANHDWTNISLAKSAFETAETFGDQLKAIVVISETGRDINLLNRYYLKQPIYVFTTHKTYARQQSLNRNVQKSLVLDGEGIQDRDAAIENIKDRIAAMGILNSEDKFLLMVNSFQGDYKFPRIFEIVKAK